MFDAVKDYKIWSEIMCKARKFGGSKTSKFRRDFQQLHDLITDIGPIPIMQQDIVSRKTAQQTAITPAHAQLISVCLVAKRHTLPQKCLKK